MQRASRRDVESAEAWRVNACLYTRLPSVLIGIIQEYIWLLTNCTIALLPPLDEASPPELFVHNGIIQYSQKGQKILPNICELCLEYPSVTTGGFSVQALGLCP